MLGSGRGVCSAFAFASAASAGLVVVSGVMLSACARSGRRELGVVDAGGDSGRDGCIGGVGTGDLADAADIGDSAARLPSVRPDTLRRCVTGSGASATASHSNVAGTRPNARSSGSSAVAHDECTVTLSSVSECVAAEARADDDTDANPWRDDEEEEDEEGGVGSCGVAVDEGADDCEAADRWMASSPWRDSVTRSCSSQPAARSASSSSMD